METMKDKLFKIALSCSGLIMLLIVAGILYILISESIPAFRQFGIWHFITSDEWNGGEERYGAFAFIVGTFTTATIALILSIPFSLSLSLFCAELYKGKKIAAYTRYFVDLLAGIPSIILGIWGYYTLRPLLISWNFEHFGYGIFTSSLILSMMIIPYSSSITINFISLVPKQLKESAYSLGATRFEVIRLIGLPDARKGIFAAFTFAYVKVLGECMIVIMLIGNTNHFPDGITGTGNTLASIIFNQFGVTSDLKLSSLLAIALLLFIITAAFNLLARYLLRRAVV
jgi:phosphate transport system permease protein